jgi:hypothetical protein
LSLQWTTVSLIAWKPSNGVFLSGAQPQAEFEKIIDTQVALTEK